MDSMMADGSTYWPVARKLGVGDETVKTLVSRTPTKLGVGRRAGAVPTARRLGLL
jgi:DNA-binding CsgD family transcriptional regulator